MLLATEPTVILLDEPMAGVASGDVPELTEVIRRLHPAAAAPCSWWSTTWTSSSGWSTGWPSCTTAQLLACDTPDAVMANPAVQSAYLGEAAMSDAPFSPSVGSAPGSPASRWWRTSASTCPHRGHRPARPQRRGQDQHHQGHHRPDRTTRRRGVRRRRRSRRNATHKIMQRGVGYVPEDREVFAELTVAENLRLAEAGPAPHRQLVAELFPDLTARGRAAGRHALRRPAADGLAGQGAAEHQQAAAGRRTDQGPRARRSSARSPPRWPGRRRRCRSCWSSRTCRSSASSPTASSCSPAAGSCTPAAPPTSSTTRT